MDTREAVTERLLAGETPAQLAKQYPRKSVYRIADELVLSGQISDFRVINVDSEQSVPLFTPVPPSIPLPSEAATAQAVGVKEKESGAETVDLGPKSFPEDAVNRIRGILGITARPKVLSMPMPELLYPAMVIAVTELGFQPMRPDDFIDTVLYQWLEACDYIPFAYMKKSEIEGYAKRYGVIQTPKKEVTEEQPESETEDVVKEKPPESKVDETDDEELVIAALEEMEEKGNEETLKTTESDIEEPRKPTVGERLKCLRIENIKKGVENDSTGRTESISSQGGNEPRE